MHIHYRSTLTVHKSLLPSGTELEGTGLLIKLEPVPARLEKLNRLPSEWMAPVMVLLDCEKSAPTPLVEPPPPPLALVTAVDTAGAADLDRFTKDKKRRLVISVVSTFSKYKPKNFSNPFRSISCAQGCE